MLSTLQWFLWRERVVVLFSQPNPAPQRVFSSEKTGGCHCSSEGQSLPPFKLSRRPPNFNLTQHSANYTTGFDCYSHGHEPGNDSTLLIWSLEWNAIKRIRVLPVGKHESKKRRELAKDFNQLKWQTPSRKTPCWAASLFSTMYRG